MARSKVSFTGYLGSSARIARFSSACLARTIASVRNFAESRWGRAGSGRPINCGRAAQGQDLVRGNGCGARGFKQVGDGSGVGPFAEREDGGAFDVGVLVLKAGAEGGERCGVAALSHHAQESGANFQVGRGRVCRKHVFDRGGIGAAQNCAQAVGRLRCDRRAAPG